MKKFCGKCGTKLDEKTGLCPNCDVNHNKQEDSSGKKSGRKKKSCMFSIIILLVILAFISVILFFFIRSGVISSLWKAAFQKAETTVTDQESETDTASEDNTEDESESRTLVSELSLSEFTADGTGFSVDEDYVVTSTVYATGDPDEIRLYGIDKIVG